MRSRLVLALVLFAGAARADLPPPGPAPDPLRGETYDGRPRVVEPAGTMLALAVPRALLLPPRLVLRLLRPPVLALVAVGDKENATTPPAVLRRPRGGISPELQVDLETLPAVGATLWSRDLFGTGRAISRLTFITSGARFIQWVADVRPNPALPVGFGLRFLGERRADAPYYGVAGEVPLTDDPTRVSVLAFDGEGRLLLRPGGAAGHWRALFGLGAGLRRFATGEGGTPAPPDEVPGFFTGATWVEGDLAIERLSSFDVSRGLAGFDFALGARPTFGVGSGAGSRYLTLAARAVLGVPLAGGRVLTLSGLVADQQSFGDAPVDFYDRLTMGGDDLQRGFPAEFFRGGSLAIATIEYRRPLALWMDGFAFIDEGGVWGEGFSDFDSSGLRTSIGVGVRTFRRNDVFFQALIGWGIGESIHLSVVFGAPPDGPAPAALIQRR